MRFVSFRSAALTLLLALGLVACPGAPPPPMTDAGSDVGETPDAPPTPTCAGPPGLYVEGSCTELAPGVRRFEPNYWLWSDDADKDRFFSLPAGTTIDTTDPDAWVFPVGTRFWKTFIRDGLRIETRLLTKVSEGSGASHWTLQTFAWSMDQLSVTEVTDGVVNALGTSHDIPSTSLCINCHSGAGVDVGLGFSAIQLNHADTDTSLEDLVTEGLLSSPILLADAVVPGDAATSEALGYLHANCGNCHGGPRPMPAGDPMDLWVDVGTPDVMSTGAATTAFNHTSGWPGAPFRISTGEPDNSAVILRMESRVPGTQMPPIATEAVDTAAVTMMRAWVSGL